jgi:RNA methyltransferase, TrmH family
MNEIAKISSRDNAKLVTARKVRDGRIKGSIFIEGLRLAEEAVRSALNIENGFAKSDFGDTQRGRELLDSLHRSNVAIAEVPDRLFDSIADTKNSQGIILIAERPGNGRSRIEEDLRSRDPALVVFLSEINDPANLGAVFRTAEAAGVTGIIVSSRSADVFSSKAVRSAMGASFRLPVWENADFADAIEWARQHGLRTGAADTASAIDHTQFDWTGRILVVFGSEANGLSTEQLEMVDETMCIPMQNGVESLNLAVASGIILFEAIRQRTSQG